MHGSAVLSNVQNGQIDIFGAHILLVDDDQMHNEILENSLSEFERISMCNNGSDAIEFCRKQQPDLVVLDVLMPGLDGHEACKVIKTLPNMESCPIIFSTFLNTIEDEVSCWEAGGSDFVGKPVIPLTLKRRIFAHLQVKLRADQDRALSNQDPLTGLFNRRFFDDYYARQYSLAKRMGSDLSVIVFDIDYFKQFNDTYGHAEGDKCLKQVANSIGKFANRPTDAAVRFGGEEFVLVLPNTNLAGAKHLVAGIFKDIDALNIEHSSSELGRVSVSAGIATLANYAQETDLFIEADKNLYCAKNQGRARYCC
jgi:diguanylate cyclase (GGDEF)-like protein